MAAPNVNITAAQPSAEPVVNGEWVVDEKQPAATAAAAAVGAAAENTPANRPKAFNTFKGHLREAKVDDESPVIPFNAAVETWRQQNAALAYDHIDNGGNGDGDGGNGGGIRVCVRVRPVLEALGEAATDTQYPLVSCMNPVAFVHAAATRLGVPTGALCSRPYHFDHAFGGGGPGDDNADVYAAAVAPLVAKVVAGGAATVIAFGQTGGGKTHTMRFTQEQLAVDLLAAAAGTSQRLFVSFFENCGERFFDLLHARAELPPLREDASGTVHITGCREVEVATAADATALLAAGSALRATHPTKANPDSSRSHAVCQLVLKEARKPVVEILQNIFFRSGGAALHTATARSLILAQCLCTFMTGRGRARATWRSPRAGGCGSSTWPAPSAVRTSSSTARRASRKRRISTGAWAA